MCLCENFRIRPLYLKLLNFVFNIEPLTVQSILGFISQTKVTAPYNAYSLSSEGKCASTLALKF
mgnify:FL=1